MTIILILLLPQNLKNNFGIVPLMSGLTRWTGLVDIVKQSRATLSDRDLESEWEKFDNRKYLNSRADSEWVSVNVFLCYIAYKICSCEHPISVGYTLTYSTSAM